MQKGKFRVIEGGRLLFYCPGCDSPHTIRHGKKHDWTFDGDYDQPTISPSVLTRGGHKRERICHLFLKKGQLQFLGDCTHKLAGKTVPLPELPECYKD